MRKSEAELLLDHLQEEYDGPLTLEVWNLQHRGHPFNLPEMEHPYFVVGIPSGVEQGPVLRESKQEETEKIMVWSSEGKQMEVERIRCRKLTKEMSISESEVYVFDTRRRDFVPASKFRLPPDQT